MTPNTNNKPPTLINIMADKSFEFRFSEKQLIALQDAAANHVNPWADEEDPILEDLAEVFSQALDSRNR